MKEVLQKIIAASGIASRRGAEALIREGLVKLNGYTAKLGERADENDEIVVDGKRIQRSTRKVYIKLNKPMGYTCTNRYFKGEKNIYSLVDMPERLFAIGRLDKDSRGLVILTNDGEMTAKLTHAKFGSEKKYLVRVAADDRLLKKATIDQTVRTLKKGVDLGEGEGLGWAKAAEYLNGVFTLVLTTGRKRQVRRMFQGLHYHVVDLFRTEIAGVMLGDLPEGKWQELSDYELNKLKVKINAKEQR
jgi:23S rRNA pseudouridine2604 synthase